MNCQLFSWCADKTFVGFSLNDIIQAWSLPFAYVSVPTSSGSCSSFAVTEHQNAAVCLHYPAWNRPYRASFDTGLRTADGAPSPPIYGNLAVFLNLPGGFDHIVWCCPSSSRLKNSMILF